MALVDSPPVGRMLLVVLVATATGATLAALGSEAVRERVPRAAIVAAAVLAGMLGLALALGAAGLPLRLLEPRHWDELYDGVDRGLAVAGSTDWPYEGTDAWVRLTILLGAPLFVGVAALLAFFPARRAAPLLRFARAGGPAGRLRHGGGRPRPGRAAAARHGPADPRRRLAVAAAAEAARGACRCDAGAGARGAVAPGRRRAGRAAALARLPLVGLVRERQGGHLRLDPPLRPARTGRATAPRCSTSSRSSRTTGRPRCSTRSTACAGCAGARATRPRRRTGPAPPRPTATGTTTSGTASGTRTCASRFARCRPSCSWLPALPTESRAPGLSRPRRTARPTSPRRSSRATATRSRRTCPTRRWPRCAARPAAPRGR